jgi:hypothetical protein
MLFMEKTNGAKSPVCDDASFRLRENTADCRATDVWCEDLTSVIIANRQRDSNLTAFRIIQITLLNVLNEATFTLPCFENRFITVKHVQIDTKLIR